MIEKNISKDTKRLNMQFNNSYLTNPNSFTKCYHKYNLYAKEDLQAKSLIKIRGFRSTLVKEIV